MGDIIEGRNAVLEALRSGTPIEEILLSRGNKPHPALDEIVDLSRDSGIRVREVDRGELEEMSARGAHQGVVAKSAPFTYEDIDGFLSSVDAASPSLVLALDHVTDPGNLGAAIRSAEALGADCVVIPKARSATVGPVVWKTAAGALAHLPVVQVSNLVRSLEKLKEAGYWVLGASEDGPSGILDGDMDDKQVLVLGAEGEGLSRLVQRSCDELVGIPLTGRTSSLNVAQAATILIWEWTRRKSR